MKKIRLLAVNPASTLGGGTNISNNLILKLDKNHFNIFAFFPKLGLASNQIYNKIKIITPPKSNIFSILLFLRKFIKKNKINIIHLHGTRAAIWGRLSIIGLKDKPKVIYTLHGFHIIRRPFFIKYLLIILEKILNHWTDVLVCVSDADKKLVLKYKIISEQKIKVIKNGINLEKFQENKSKTNQLKKDLNLENSFIISSIARLHKQKDISTILRAIKIIIPKINNIQLLIIGNGPLRQNLEKEANNLKINKNIKFLGTRKDVADLMNISDVIILSSKWEGLPLTTLESGACHKPIIASDIDGIRETIKNNITGFLFQPKSEKDLANKILKLYNSKKLRLKMGKENYNFILRNFNEQKMINLYRKLYYSVN